MIVVLTVVTAMGVDNFSLLSSTCSNMKAKQQVLNIASQVVKIPRPRNWQDQALDSVWTMHQSEFTKMLLTCKMSRILTGCVVRGLRTMPHFSSVGASRPVLSGKKPDKQLDVRTCGHFAGVRKEGVCGEPSRPISAHLVLLFFCQRNSPLHNFALRRICL